MLGYLRKHGQSLFTKLLFGTLALIFIIFFGSSTLTSNADPVVAEVNGRAIREQEVNRLWRQRVRMQQQFNPRMGEAEQQAIRQQVIDELIERRLVIAEAEREGFVVSPKEYRQAILQDPSFQDENGKFDLKQYEEFLGRDPRTARRLQDSLRDGLLASGIEDFIRRGVQVSDEEVRRAWIQENSKRNVEFLKVDSAQFRDEVAMSDAEIDAWIGEHQEAVRAQYDEDFDRVYNQPKKVRARHILMKFEESDPESARAEVRRRMEAVLAAARADGADFEALAKEYSEDSSAPRGGDLGFFDDKRMVAPFTAAAFALQPGQVSELVETQYGLHVIKVEEVQEAKVQSFDEVKRSIALELVRDEKAPEKAKEFATRLLGVLDGSLDAAAAAELLGQKGLVLDETGEFNAKSRAIPKVGRAPEAVAAAFALAEVGSVSKEPVETSSGFVVLKLKTKTDADVALFDAEKDEMRDRLLRTRQTRAVDAWKSGLKEKARIQVAPGA
jgi:peptidyl-prolyl cis-trans isomerase D